jgi:hypothetical protein
MNNEDFDDDEEVDNIEKLLFCSICHKNTFDIITDHYKKNCVLKEILKSTDYSELIKKCNCKINNEEIHSHKFCVLLKILFKYETRCEKCKTDYNIKITKKLDRKKFLTSIIFYLIIYIIHLFFFLFCVFLLFIHDILKEFMKSNKIISYRHLFIFFGIIIFFINCFFLYFSVINNIKQFKINVYNYLIDILDAEEDDKNKTKTIPLLNEFQEWAHSQSLKDLIYDVNNKFFFNRIYSSYINEVNGIIDQNNGELKNNMDNINIISVDSNENKYLDNLQSNLNLFSNNNLFNNNPKFLQINNLFNKQNEEINFSSLQSSKLNNENNENENSNNNIIIHNNNSNNFIRKKSKRGIHSSLKLNHTLNDYINININPSVTSKNINININFSNEKNSQIEQISTSKEFTLRSGRALRRNSKIGKTALIPKKLMMTNIINDNNIFKRKKRQLNSIKIRRNPLNLKNTQITGNIDEEIDFSSIEDMHSGFSKGTGDINKRILSPKSSSKFGNFRTKKSFKDVSLNISNSVNEEGDFSKFQNGRNSIQTNGTNKKVHFVG